MSCNATALSSDLISSCTPDPVHSIFFVDRVCDFVHQNICSVYFATPAPNNPVQPHHLPTQAEIWGYGFLAVFLVSAASVVGVLFAPLMKTTAYTKILTGMVGLGVGCLCGSAVLHLIPQAFQLTGGTPEEHERYLFKALVILATIFAFLMIERMFRMWILRKKELDGSAAALPEKAPHNAAHRHSHAEITPKDIQQSPIKTVAWMIIAGDGIVDGLSMGAAFATSIWGGISLSIAVLCEELPHELGDLAILLNAGMPLKTALLYNFLSACVCFVGLVIGILLGELPDAGPWIFAISAGMFLYISLVSMLPEMTEAVEEACARSFKSGVGILAIQSFGILAGFTIMFVLMRYGTNIDVQ